MATNTAASTVEPRTLATLLVMLTPPRPTLCELRQRATRILAELLAVGGPTLTWRLHGIPSGEDRANEDYEPYRDNPTTCPLLEGQADTHQAVRDYAAHFGTEVVLRNGTAPTTVAVINGVGVRVWCAPQYRDDTPSSTVAGEGEGACSPT